MERRSKREKLRTCALFESELFNVHAPKESFVHPQNFGDDLACWFMNKLKDRKVRVEEDGPDQEDHGWYLTFALHDESYDLVITHIPGESDFPRWLACLERSVGLFGSIIGQRHRSLAPEAVELVAEVLTSSSECRNIRWLYFKDVRRGRLEEGAKLPRELGR